MPRRVCAKVSGAYRRPRTRTVCYSRTGPRPRPTTPSSDTTAHAARVFASRTLQVHVSRRRCPQKKNVSRRRERHCWALSNCKCNSSIRCVSFLLKEKKEMADQSSVCTAPGRLQDHPMEFLSTGRPNCPIVSQCISMTGAPQIYIRYSITRGLECQTETVQGIFFFTAVDPAIRWRKKKLVPFLRKTGLKTDTRRSRIWFLL